MQPHSCVVGCYDEVKSCKCWRVSRFLFKLNKKTMSKERIKLTDTTTDIIVKMSDGNPGALNVIMGILIDGEKIDPDCAMGGLGLILLLDTFGIYGTDIYVLHNDICNGKLNLTIACLRACQLGLFPIETLKQACARQDGSGTSFVIPDALLLSVKNSLPKFYTQTVPFTNQ